MRHLDLVATMGINISDKTQDYTGQILRGSKVVETRRTQSLRPYVGKRIGIVRTGRGKAMLVGYATVGEPIFYGTVEEFRADEVRHRVAAGSKHDFTSAGKYGYPMLDVVAVDPVPVYSRGIVARKLAA